MIIVLYHLCVVQPKTKPKVNESAFLFYPCHFFSHSIIYLKENLLENIENFALFAVVYALNLFMILFSLKGVASGAQLSPS